MTDPKVHLVLIGGINNSAIVWDGFALHSPPWLELHRRVCPALDDVNDILNKKSGMLGLTGFSDMRDIQNRYDQGEKSAMLAYEMYAYHIRKYIGSFAAVQNGLDGIIFTAGVGENDTLTRKLVCQDMDFLGIRLDEVKNVSRQKGLQEINEADSKVKILVIPTNEELEIAKQCFELVGE